MSLKIIFIICAHHYQIERYDQLNSKYAKKIVCLQISFFKGFIPFCSSTADTGYCIIDAICECDTSSWYRRIFDKGNAREVYVKLVITNRNTLLVNNGVKLTINGLGHVGPPWATLWASVNDRPTVAKSHSPCWKSNIYCLTLEKLTLVGLGRFGPPCGYKIM